MIKGELDREKIGKPTSKNPIPCTAFSLEYKKRDSMERNLSLGTSNPAEKKQAGRKGGRLRISGGGGTQGMEKGNGVARQYGSGPTEFGLRVVARGGGGRGGRGGKIGRFDVAMVFAGVRPEKGTGLLGGPVRSGKMDQGNQAWGGTFLSELNPNWEEIWNLKTNTTWRKVIKKTLGGGGIDGGTKGTGGYLRVTSKKKLRTGGRKPLQILSEGTKRRERKKEL